MYFANISNSEVAEYHKKIKNNITMSLTDAISSDLFKKEVIVANKLYKLYPLFYCDEITSSNAEDEIFENKCIVCLNNDDTVLSFKSINKTITGIHCTYKKISNNCWCGCVYNDELEAIKDADVVLANATNSERTITDYRGLFYLHTDKDMTGARVTIKYNGEECVL